MARLHNGSSFQSNYLAADITGTQDHAYQAGIETRYTSLW